MVVVADVAVVAAATVDIAVVVVGFEVGCIHLPGWPWRSVNAGVPSKAVERDEFPCQMCSSVLLFEFFSSSARYNTEEEDE